MLEYMQLKHYSPNTIKSCVNIMAAYARHMDKNPELSSWEEVKSYLLYLVETRRCSVSHLSQAHSAFKVLFVHYLHLRADRPQTPGLLKRLDLSSGDAPIF